MAITFYDRAEAVEYAATKEKEGYNTKLRKVRNTYQVKLGNKEARKLWHVTYADRVPSIMEKGLIPRYAPPAGQTWMPLKEAIYLYPDKETPLDQMEQTEEYAPGAMALLEITIPEELTEKLGTGEEDEPIFEGRIPPEYIRRIR